MNERNSRWADEVLRRVRASAAPTPSDEARVFASLEAQLGTVPQHLADGGRADLASGEGPAGLAPSGAARAPSRAAALTSRSGVLAKLALLGAFGLGTGAIGYLWGSHDREHAPESSVSARQPNVEAAPASVAAETIAPNDAAERNDNAEALPATDTRAVAPEQPSETPRTDTTTRTGSASRAVRTTTSSASARHRPVGSAASATPAALAFGLRGALEALQQAHLALRDNDPSRALELITELDGKIPNELLREERLLARTLTLCALGDVAGASRAGRELERVDAESIYQSRIEQSCARSKSRRSAH